MVSKVKKNFNLNKDLLLISIILTLFLFFGYAIDKTSTIDILFNNLKKAGITLVLFLAFTIFFYNIIKLFYNYLDTIKSKTINSKIYDFIFEKHSFICPFLILLILGLPIIIYFYPGTIQWDGIKQLDYFFGIFKWSNHHPAFSTLLMGICLKIGNILINDNFGIFIYTFIQYILSCLIFTYLISFLKNINTPKPFIIIVFLFFCITPIWYINAYTLVKDTMFYLLFIVYYIQFIKYYYNSNRNNFILLIISSLFVILFRNNGLYIVLLSFIALFLKEKKNKKNVYLILVVILFQIAYSFTLSICHISNGNIREMLSVPLQQTARYVSTYNIDIQEQEIIENLFNSDIQTIKTRYNPEISDPIKFHFNVKNTKELLTYFGIWAKQFSKHPKIYFDSFLQNYYGYFYPNKKEVKDDIVWFSIINNKRVNTGYFDFYMTKKYEKNRNTIEEFVHNIRNFPVIGLLFNCGFYTWILLIFMAYTIYKKEYSYLLISVPLVATLAFCFLSPVNAYIRYMNPIIVCLPIYIGLIIHTKK